MNELFKMMVDKFERGAIEHDSDLSSLSQKELVLNALEESIDKTFYLYVLYTKIDE